jgi:gluconolactonase
VSRRVVIRALAAAAGAVAIAPSMVHAQGAGQPGTGPAGPVNPPTTTTSPQRDFTAPSVYFSDPDILAYDPAFGGLTQGNTTLARLCTAT